jgi:hypothetical protein
MTTFAIFFRALRVLSAVVLIPLAMSSCAARQVVIIAPAVNAEQTALRLEDHTRLSDPVRIVFDWELNEAGVRVKGRGVARIEPPYRARVDLFLGNNEPVLKAVLLGGTLIMPPGAPSQILPPPDLFWATLGVFRPNYGAELLGGDELEADALRLRYAYEDGKELHYRIEAGTLRTVELLESGSVVQRVEIDLNPESRYPVQATYRNLAAFRELKITRDRLERVESYPADIWDPIGGLR